MKTRNIVLMESSVIITEGLQKIINETPELKVQKVYRSYPQVVGRSGADILVVNPKLLREEELDKLFQDWKRENDELVILALHTDYTSAVVLKMFDNVIERDDNVSVILNKLRTTRSKNTDKGSTQSCELSAREKDVLKLVAKGLTNKEIADELNLSVHTVITHRKNITSKTNIKSISGLTIYAMLNKLIQQ